MKRFGDPGPRTWASDHERARQRAAERLSLPLPAPEAAWLDHHLRTCPSCARVAAQYEAHRDALRATALDRPAARPLGPHVDGPRCGRSRARRRIGRPTSAARTSSRQAPGRAASAPSAPNGGPWRRVRLRGPGIGRLGRGAPRRTANPRWAVPFAGLAAFTIVLATGGGLLIATRPGGLALAPRGIAAAPRPRPGPARRRSPSTRPRSRG